MAWHAYVHTCIHAYLHTYMLAYMQAYINAGTGRESARDRQTEREREREREKGSQRDMGTAAERDQDNASDEEEGRSLLQLSKIASWILATPNPFCWLHGARLFWGISLGFLGLFCGFLRLDNGKSAGVTRMALMPKLQLVCFGYFFWFCGLCGNFEASPDHV